MEMGYTYVFEGDAILQVGHDLADAILEVLPRVVDIVTDRPPGHRHTSCARRHVGQTLEEFEVLESRSHLREGSLGRSR
jgi:hypothetical protein